MSATIHVELYREYFSNQSEYYGDMDCLSVGSRRFPLDIKHIDDIITNKLIPIPLMRCAQNILDTCKHCDGSGTDNVPPKLASDQYTVAMALIRTAPRGTGVLVFVSGILDIQELTEKLADTSNFRVFAIHSDIPFEEQEAAFLPAGTVPGLFV